MKYFKKLHHLFPYRRMVINNTANFCSKIADRIFWFEAEFLSDCFYMNTTETPLKIVNTIYTTVNK